MSIVQAAIIGSAAGAAGSGYPVPGSGSYAENAGVSNVNGTPYDPGGAQASVENSAAGFYRRTVQAEWWTGSYAGTDMAFFNNKTIVEELADTYVSFGDQPDVKQNYSMYWLGYFRAPTTTTYNLSISSDDQSMVWIGTNAISGFTGSNCVATQNTTTANSLSLTGGQWYPIRIWYNEIGGNNTCQLFIGQTGALLYNVYLWASNIAYNSVTNGLNQTPRVNAIPGNTWSGLSLQNTPTNNTSYLTFNGTNQYATVTPGLIDATPSGSFSIELWVRTTTDNGVLLADGITGYNASLIEFVSGDIVAGFYNVGGHSGTVQSPAGRNYWHHYVYAYNAAGPQLEFFIDGVRVNLNLGTKAGAGAVLALFKGGVGTYFGDNTSLAGDLGEFRLWDSLLSDTKVQAQYDNTKSAYLPTFALTTSGVSATSVDEGTALTFDLATTNVLDGTTLHWAVSSNGSYSIDAGRFSPGTSGSFTVTSNAGSFSITVSADVTTATGVQNYAVSLTTDGSTSVGNNVSVTVNDTSQTIPQWHNGDATASGRSVSYRYYKFHITKIKNISQSLGGSTQISELIILNGNTKLTGGTATNPGGTQAFPSEGPSKALTGYYNDKWCDTAFAVNGYSTLIIDYTTPQTSTGFTYATANDYSGRDPVQWTFEGSNDGSTWDVLHEQIVDATITTSRNTLVSSVFSYPTRGSAVFNRSNTDTMSVAAGSHFNLGTTWTIEFSIYMNGPSADIGTSGIQGLLNQGGWFYGIPSNSILIGLSSGFLNVGQGTTDTQIYFPEPTPQQWVHVAIVNNAGVQKAYYNGVEQIKLGDNGGSANYTNTDLPLYIGSLTPTYGSPFSGKLTNLRITNTAVYTANFYPPTILPAKIAGTKLLWRPTDQELATDLSDNGLAITNTNNVVTYSSSYPDVNVLDGSAVFSSNSYMKVGYASITAPTTADSGNAGGLPNPPSPDGTGTYTRINLATYPDIVPGMTFVYDNITFTVAQAEPQSNHAYDDLGLVTFYPRYNGTIPNGTNLTFNPAFQPFGLGTTWTIEWWSKATTATVYHGAGLYVVMSAGPGNDLIDIYYQDNLLHAGNNIEICTEPPAGVWTHVAMVNSNGSLKVYYNGVAQTVNAYNYNLTNSTNHLYIGCRGSYLFQNFVGKLTNIRITNTEVYTGNFTPGILPTLVSGHTKLLYTPTVDTVYGVDTGDLGLPMSNKNVLFNSDYPQIVVGGIITATVAGNNGLNTITYTVNAGVAVSSIAVKDGSTLGGGISIVDTTIYYTAPCFQGTYIDDKTGYDHTGSEIDNFSLYFIGNFGKTIVPVSITINAV